MAQQTVRFAALYFNNKKEGKLENVTFSIQANDEDIIITEGWDGASDGAITCKAEANCISPIAGTTIDFIGKILNKEYVDVGIPLAGKIVKFTGRLMGADFASDAKTGKTTGKFSITGGKVRSV